MRKTDGFELLVSEEIVKTIEINNILDKFKKLKVLVLGDVGIDSYVVGDVKRISPEAPVPVVEVKETYHRLGLAANVVNNVVALGATCELIGVIGNDKNATYLREELAELKTGINGLVVDADRPTTHKTRVLASKLHHVVRIDSEDKTPLDSSICEEIKKRLHEMIIDVDIVILEDYGKGLFKNGLAKELISICNEHEKHVLIDPSRHMATASYQGATIFKPNLDEAQILSGVEVFDTESFLKCGNKLLKDLKADFVIITRGKDGMTVFSKETDPHTIPTFALEVFDVSGAGDTVISTLALAYAAGVDVDKCVYVANAAAAVVVGKVGTSVATPIEIVKFLKEHHSK